MELQAAIAGRRSVRKFTDYYVTDEELKKILEAARLAPSWANTQVWSYVIVRDPDLIHDVVDTYSKINPARSGSDKASVLIACCAKINISGCNYKGEGTATKFKEWFMFDLGLAVQTLCLKAYELGLGTVIVGHMDHDACKKLLLVPDGYEVVAVIPVGKPLEPDKKGPSKKELKDIVYLDKFGEMYAKIY